MRSEKEIGEIIRELRGKDSLRDFAKKCNISHTTIDNLEKGVDFRTQKPVQVKLETLRKISETCGVSISYLIGESQTQQFSVQEQLVIQAYRSNPHIQYSVDKLLGIEQDPDKYIALYAAALSEDHHQDQRLLLERKRWKEIRRFRQEQAPALRLNLF